MVRTKITFAFFIAIIMVLSIILFDVLSSRSTSVILHRFDKTEINRLDEMVMHHHLGKGDYLMLIPPIIDSGYWIHEVRSDGQQVTWTVDNTRDAHSDQMKKVYRCEGISKLKEKDHYVYVLEQCENESEKSLPIFRVQID